MKTNKRILLILLLGHAIALTIAQPTKNLDYYKQYFIDNYQTLDRIEGIWDYDIERRHYTKDSEGRISEDGKHTEGSVYNHVVIIRDGTSYKTYYFDVLDNLVKADWFFKSLDYSKTTNHDTYRFSLFRSEEYFSGNARFFSENEFSFDFVIKQTYGDRSKSVYLEKLINYTYKFTKIFPSLEDIKATKKQPTTGTGFAITSKGHIATCYHVVEGASQILIRGINGDFNKTYSANIITYDSKNDLAILQINDSAFKLNAVIPYVIKSSTVEVGTSIFLLGYPLTATMGDEIKLTDGIISAKSGFKGDITAYQITAAAQSGNSGGPLFDKNGNLIGIINAKHSEAENATYAVKSSYLINLIESLPVAITLQKSNTLTGKSMPDLVKRIKTFVYIVEVQ